MGLTRGVNRNHIIRATLESLAYQVNDVLQAMSDDCGKSLTLLKVDGGASANNLLLQMQADLCQVPIYRPKCVETTALGAAYLAGLAAGYWKDQEEIRENWEVDRVFASSISQEEREQKLDCWHRAVKCAMGWIPS